MVFKDTFSCSVFASTHSKQTFDGFRELKVLKLLRSRLTVLVLSGISFQEIFDQFQPVNSVILNHELKIKFFCY